MYKYVEPFQHAVFPGWWLRFGPVPITICGHTNYQSLETSDELTDFVEVDCFCKLVFSWSNKEDVKSKTLSGNSLHCIADISAVNCRHYLIRARKVGWLVSTNVKKKYPAKAIFFLIWSGFLILRSLTDCPFAFLFAGPPLQYKVTLWVWL